MAQPSFIIGGAAKAGTSALYVYLNQHPQIFMCHPKEPRYFAFRGVRPDFRGPGDEERFNAKTVYKKEDYYKLFSEAGGNVAIGEASPIYIHMPGCAQAIYSELPSVNLIFILRHPVERLNSAYMHQVRANQETLSLEDALAAELSRIEANWAWHWRYSQLGFVADRIRSFVDLFPKKQLLFIKYDDFLNDNARILKTILRFIGVDETFEFRSVRENVGGRPKDNLLGGLLRDRQHWLKRLARPVVPTAVRRAIFKKLHLRNLQREMLPAGHFKRLLQLYEHDIKMTQELTGLDLQDWLRTRRGVASN